LSKFIGEERSAISKEYETLNKYMQSGISYDSWLNNKATVKLVENLNEKLGQLILEKEKIEEDLAKYKSDDEINRSRVNQSNVFETTFSNNLNHLGVQNLQEDRFTRLYQISAFPTQGVELHKTIMAYHFAFNSIVSSTPGIHRLPFMLDAVFKEDVEDANKKAILTFINKNKPQDTQTIFSIAQIEG
jgi:hypothetical protein